jgi:hypothetical protein
MYWRERGYDVHITADTVYPYAIRSELIDGCPRGAEADDKLFVQVIRKEPR